VPDLLETSKPQRTFDLTIVVPAYNEESRLPVMMKETIPYLEAKSREGKIFKSVEMILVNDGSKDQTGEIIR
jgi:dolichyl-phosphate beta-glucosyltransferase